MANKRTITNLFEKYLDEKGVSDDTMAKQLQVNVKTFTKMRKEPLTIKLEYAYKIAQYFKEYVPHFIDHVLIGDLFDNKQEIDTEGTDWDLDVVNDMKQQVMQPSTSVDEHKEEQESFKVLKKGEFEKGNEPSSVKEKQKTPTVPPTKIDPVTGVMVLVDDKDE